MTPNSELQTAGATYQFPMKVAELRIPGAKTIKLSTINAANGDIHLEVPATAFPFAAPGDFVIVTLSMLKVSLAEPSKPVSGLIIPGRQDS